MTQSSWWDVKPQWGTRGTPVLLANAVSSQLFQLFKVTDSLAGTWEALAMGRHTNRNFKTNTVDGVVQQLCILGHTETTS